VRLVEDGRRFRRLTSQPNFKSFKIITSDLVAVNMSKKEIKLVKPTYVGMSILDLSKTFMYAFHYDKIANKYGDKAILLMTDTDSLVYHIETLDVYDDMRIDANAYDTSDYPQHHPAYSYRNCKVLGKMKDEYNGRPIAEFVGLRPKMYSVLEADGQEKKKAKGIARRTTARMLHSAFIESLEKEKTTSTRMQAIRSINHTVYTMEISKIGLSPYDDKRYVQDDRISTLAFGHYRTRRAQCDL